MTALNCDRVFLAGGDWSPKPSGEPPGAVERSAPSGQTVRYSGRLSGSLDQLLERLLRHEGHVIVRSAEARGGIARVVLMETKGGTTPAPGLAGPMAAIKARLGFMEGK